MVLAEIIVGFPSQKPLGSAPSDAQIKAGGANCLGSFGRKWRRLKFLICADFTRNHVILEVKLL